VTYEEALARYHAAPASAEFPARVIAAVLNVHTRWLDRDRQSGHPLIPFLRLNGEPTGQVRYRKEDVEAYRERNRVGRREVA